MTTTFYRGEFLQFHFNKYIDIHLQAHWYYEQAKPGALTKSMKILHFKGGIWSEAGMETSIESFRRFPHVNTSFTAFLNYRLEGLNSKKIRAKAQKGEPAICLEPLLMTTTAVAEASKDVDAEEEGVVGEDGDRIKATITTQTIWKQL